MSSDVDDFYFYLQFTKPIVLNLPDAKDRAIAALWLKKLGDINEGKPENDLHVEYLKLLLFAAQNRKLSGIFEKPPPEGSLEPFPQHHTVLDMMRLVKSTKVKDTSLPPIHVSASADLCEFVSIQEIPNFGIHGYYAVSTEPLTKWIRPRTGKPVRHVPCYKDTCKLSKLSNFNKQDTDNQPMEATQVPETNAPEVSTDDWDISLLPQMHSKIEIPFMGGRPCWGTNRYIERLIDQSPHIVGDFHSSAADAVLHIFKERKMKPAKKGGPCLLPSKRRQVEKMLDLPPCTQVPGDTESSSEENIDIYSCLPKCEDHTDIGWTDYCILDREKQAVQSPMGRCLPKDIFSKHQRKPERPETSRQFPNQPKHTGKRQMHDKMDKHKDHDTTKLDKIIDGSDLYYSDWITDVPDLTSITQSLPFPPRTPADIDFEKDILPESLDFEVPKTAQSKLPRSPPRTPSPPLTSMRARPPSLPHRSPPPPPPLPPTPRPVHVASETRVQSTNLPGSESTRYAELQMPYMEQPFTLPPNVTVRNVLSEYEVSDQNPYQQDIDEEFYAFTAFDRGSEPEAQVSSYESSRGRTLSRSPQQEFNDEYTTYRRSDPQAMVSLSEQPNYTQSSHATDGQSVNRTRFVGTLPQNVPADQSGFVSLYTANHERSQFEPENSYLPRMSQEERQSSFRRNLQPRPYTRSFNYSGTLRADEQHPDASGFVTLQTGYGSGGEIAPGDSYYPQHAESYSPAFYERNRASNSGRTIVPHSSSHFHDSEDDTHVFWPTAHSTFNSN